MTDWSLWTASRSPDDIVNIYFHQKHIEAGLSAKGCIFDVFNQIKYSKNPGYHRLMEKLIFLFMSSYTKIIPVDPIAYQAAMEAIFTPPKEAKGGIIALENHETYVGPPLLVWHLIEWALAHGTPEMRDNIHTVYGPLLSTHKRYMKVISSVSHGLKTLPKTGNLPTDLDPELVKTHRKAFRNEFNDIVRVPGNITIVAAWGERDVTKWNDDGTVDCVYMLEDEAIKHSLIMIQKCIHDWARLVMSAMHEAELKHPFKILSGSGGWTPWNTYLNLKVLDQAGFDSLRDQKMVMPTLAEMLQDGTGRSLGKVVPREEFDHLKSTLNTSHLLGKKRESDFEDSFKKAIIRQLFKLFM